jgi:hypothetical protein
MGGRFFNRSGAWTAVVSAAAVICAPAMGAAQTPYAAPPPGQAAPPPGEYAPPAPAYADQGPAPAYDPRAQQADRDYAERYSAWAARNCVDRRNTNAVAGAVIGGVLGAVVGSNVAGRGDRGAGTVVGGALGATAGAAVGASSGEGADCPPGYVVREGAPAFYYGPGWGPEVYYAGPAWYQPWFWVGGQWIYRPYRSWYWGHRAYWRPAWRGGYRRWRR